MYNKNEALRIFGASPLEFHARSKDKLHLMRNISFENTDDELRVKIDNKIVYSTKPKMEETSLDQFLFRVLDDLSFITSISYSFNELFAFMNFINDSIHQAFFPSTMIVEPDLTNNLVLIDIPCVLLQNPLRQIISYTSKHCHYKLPIHFNHEDPINSVIQIFYQVEDFLIEIGQNHFEEYDSYLDMYKDSVIGGLFYFFLLLKEQTLICPNTKKGESI